MNRKSWIWIGAGWFVIAAIVASTAMQDYQMAKANGYLGTKFPTAWPQTIAYECAFAGAIAAVGVASALGLGRLSAAVAGAAGLLLSLPCGWRSGYSHPRHHADESSRLRADKGVK